MACAYVMFDHCVIPDPIHKKPECNVNTAESIPGGVASAMMADMEICLWIVTIIRTDISK